MRNLRAGHMVRLNLSRMVAVFGVLAATAVPAFATTAVAVPEIDGASLSAGLGLLAGGLLMLRARRGSK